MNDQNSCDSPTKEVLDHLEKNKDIEKILIFGFLAIATILAIGISIGLAWGVYASSFDWMQGKLCK